MAIPTITGGKISQYVRSELEKILSTLPQQGSDVRLPPPKVIGPGWDESRHSDGALRPSFPLPADPEPGRYYPLAPTPPTISDIQPMVRKDDILLTPPISKDVIITPSPMTDKSSLLLPLLVAGAILLMQ